MFHILSGFDMSANIETTTPAAAPAPEAPKTAPAGAPEAPKTAPAGSPEVPKTSKAAPKWTFKLPYNFAVNFTKSALCVVICLEILAAIFEGLQQPTDTEILVGF